MEKSTISMAIFNRYVKLAKGIVSCKFPVQPAEYFAWLVQRIVSIDL